MNQKQVLKAFLSKKLKEQQLELDDATLELFYKHLKLEERPPNEVENHLSLTKSETSDGEITYESFKLYNLAQVAHYDLLQFFYKELGLTLIKDNWAKVIYGLGALLIEFYPKLKIKFEKQDAQVLHAIAVLEKKEFTLAEVEQSYQKLFSATLADKKLTASLKYLKNTKVIQYRNDEKTAFQLKEKIKNLSRD